MIDGVPPGALPLDGFRVQVSEHMVGAKLAVRIGDTIHVSPAMWALMDGASPEELERLLAAIPLLAFPVRPSLAELSMSLPMVTRKGGW